MHNIVLEIEERVIMEIVPNLRHEGHIQLVLP